MPHHRSTITMWILDYYNGTCIVRVTLGVCKRPKGEYHSAGNWQGGVWPEGTWETGWLGAGSCWDTMADLARDGRGLGIAGCVARVILANVGGIELGLVGCLARCWRPLRAFALCWESLWVFAWCSEIVAEAGGLLQFLAVFLGDPCGVLAGSLWAPCGFFLRGYLRRVAV